MITKKMEADLKAKGFSQGEIDKMTPQQAHDALTAAAEEPVAAEPAAAKPAAEKPPTPLDDAIGAAEDSAAAGDAKGAQVNLAEAERLLGTEKLKKADKESMLTRVARVKAAIGEKPKPVKPTPKGKAKQEAPPPSTPETTDPAVVRIADRDYIRDENGNWHRYGKGMAKRLVGNRTLKDRLNAVWEARQAIAEDVAAQKEEVAKAKLRAKAEKEKKPAAKTESTAAPVPRTRETPSREEIGEGEPQAPPPGTKIAHSTWGEGEVVGPGPGPLTRVRFKDGSEYNFPNKVLLKWMKAPEAPKSVEPAEPGKTKEDAARMAEAEQRDIQFRETMRKAMADRVKKEKFTKGNFLRRNEPLGTKPKARAAPPEMVDKAQMYKGLAIYKEKSNYKPWRVHHESSGKLLGQFETEADAKAFALRATDEFKFDFTRPEADVVARQKEFGKAKFARIVADPYEWLVDAGLRLKRRANNEGGYISGDILNDAHEFGRRLYQRGMSYADWAVNMVKNLGEKIVGHLRTIWDSVTGRNILAHARERGGASPGGPPPDAGLRGVKHFDSRVDAEKFVADNRADFASHTIIDQGGPGVDVVYRKAPPGPTPAIDKTGQSTRPVTTSTGAVILPRYNPWKVNAPPKVNAGNGSTIKPPPPGSALGPTPPGANPPGTWAQRMVNDFRRRWEGWVPRSRAAMTLEPDTVAINTHQKWIELPIRMMLKFTDTQWYKSLEKLNRQQIADAEYAAVTRYRRLIDQGQGKDQAFVNAVQGNPLRDYFVHRRNMVLEERSAAKILDVDAPGLIDDPYLPRLTTRENQILVTIGGTKTGVVSQLRRSLGTFDQSRKYDTMHDGYANKVEYREPIEAILQRERVSAQFISTAKALQNLKDGGIVHETYADALAQRKPNYPKNEAPVKMEGFGGKDYWIRNRQEAGFIDQNFNNVGSKSQFSTFVQMANTYTRNPNLWNPLPHITKNMFFKYVMARINNATLKADTAEYARATNKELRDRFHQVFSVGEESVRMSDIMAKGSPSWFARVTQRGLLINEPSQKFIFEKADPEMRYALWKSYIRKGMGDQEAANHVYIDLIRYDENSGGLNFWKSIPGNFFSTWRTGSYVTMYKALRAHPVRTMLFFGAVEYMREIIYRKYGMWTHLPIDYWDSPMAEGVESVFKAQKEIALGRNPLKAGGDVALKTGAIVGMTALFGPGGGQAPTTIKDVMDAVQGDTAATTRLLNMFWGVSQLFNVPQEFVAYTRDGNQKHLVNIVTNAAFGTHEAIKYEPRRLGKWIPEWLPGMQYSDAQKAYARLREERETKGIKAAKTYEQRHGVTRGWWQGSEEAQIEDLLRGAGVLRQRR